MDWWTWPLTIIVLGSLLAGFWAWIARRSSNRFPPPPTWPEMWAQIKAQGEQITSLERRLSARDVELAARDRAFGHILADAAAQWPTDSPGPVFSTADIEVLGDTMPSKWATRTRKA